MPALIIADWDAVKATAIALNNLKAAADAHNLTYDAVRQRASRQKWPVGHRITKNLQKAKADAQAAAAKRQPAAVTAVTSTSEALEKDYIATGRRGRAAAAVLSTRALEHLSRKSPDKILKSAKAARDLTEISAKAGGWQDDGPNSKVTFNIAVMGSARELPPNVRGNYIFADDDPEVIDIEAETVPSENQE